MTGRELYNAYVFAMEAATTDDQDSWRDLSPVTQDCWSALARTVAKDAESDILGERHLMPFGPED